MPAEGQVQGRPPARPAQAQGSGFTMTHIILCVALFFGTNLAMSAYNAKSQTGVETKDPRTGNTIIVPGNTGDIPAFQLRPAKLDDGAVYEKVPKLIAPIWPQDSALDITVSLSPSFTPTPLNKIPSEYIVMQEKKFQMGNSSEKRTIQTKFKVPKAVQQNGTLWGHFYVGLPGAKLDPRQPGFDPASAYHFTWPLTQYLVQKKVKKTRNLLADVPDPEELAAELEDHSGPIVTNHYHPNASLSFVPGIGVRDYATLPPVVNQFVRLEATGARDGTGRNAWYYPVLFVNTFWQLRTHMIPLNETVDELPLNIDLGNMYAWQFQVMASVEASAQENARQAAFGNAVPGGGDGSEMEMIKEILLDTNPILLAITAFVSVAHVILETLAFGSDIAHYRKKKDNVGISVRSILANVFMQTVIFLYLLDNSQNTSWMIMGSQVVGILIEFWKITTVVNVRLREAPAGSLLPYRIVFEDKHQLTETEEKTKEYDEIAFKYMYVAAVPLLIGYGIYSLYYDTHKSWYSYIITTLVGAVYAYGFLMMVPSLYINYRLKSVAHLPGKSMMYKFVNTFIDDLFAFTIKMPILHRLATFRDDLIFLIYIYQRWIYKVDYSRVNEFGQGGDDEEAEEDKDKGKMEEKDEKQGAKKGAKNSGKAIKSD